MGRRLLSIAAKERWRKRKAAMEVALNEGDQNIQRASLTSQNEVAEDPSHSALTTHDEQSKHSQSAAFILKRKVPKVNNMIVRRSNRLKSFGLFGKRQGKEAVQHIDLTDCDRDQEPHVEVEPISLKPISGDVEVEPISLKPISGVSCSEIEVDYPVHTAVTNALSKLSQAFPTKRKTLKANNMIVRQPCQLKSVKRQGKEDIHHIDPTDCDTDMELHVEPICPEPIRNMSSPELIVHHLVQTRAKRPFASETTPTNLNYKVLYNDSVKKIKALTEENYQQAQKLYHVLGKVKIYENVISKDVVAFLNGWRPTGAATNLSDEIVTPALNSAHT